MSGKQNLLEWETLLEQRASSREKRRWTGVLSPLLYSGYKEWDGGHVLMGWGMYTGWGKRRAETSSLWGRRGDRLYCSIIVTTCGREGCEESGFPFLYSKTLLGFIYSFILGLPHRCYCLWVKNRPQRTEQGILKARLVDLGQLLHPGPHSWVSKSPFRR